MSDYSKLRRLVEQVEERLERPITAHLSNGLVGFRSFFKISPLNIEVLISMEENKTGEEAIDALLRCAVRLEDGQKEYSERADEAVPTDMARKVIDMRRLFGISINRKTV